MGSFSIWHWIIVIVVILLLFGKNRISTIMVEIAKGLKIIKKEMQYDDNDNETKPKSKKNK